MMLIEWGENKAQCVCVCAGVCGKVRPGVRWKEKEKEKERKIPTQPVINYLD